MAACSVCPLLAQCNASLEERLSEGEIVREEVIAGRLFAASGREVAADKVDRYAVNRKRTMGKEPELVPAPVPAPVPALAPLFLTRGQQLALFEDVAA
ncbi:hypothetical protein ABIC28_005129 [Rhodococcus sp. PvR044]|uniref:hypothetical protein n=1 Tax=Rhodococcus sp. PvR044 TaxID=3156402 RepID=UPI0033987525